VNPNASENDILALIEGTLPPERVEAVRSALLRDAELRRRVEAMVRDRQILMAAADPALTPAPPGLVQEAIEAAEREALLSARGMSKDGVAGRVREQRRSRRLVQMAIAATLLLLVCGGYVAFMLWKIGPGAEERSLAATHGPRPMMNVIGEQDADAGPPDESGASVAQGEPEDDVPDDPIAAIEKSIAEGGPDPLLEEWKQKLAQATEGVQSVEDWQRMQESGTTGESVALPSLTLDEAVRLAMENRLRIKVRGDAHDVGARLMAFAADHRSADVHVHAEDRAQANVGADLAKPDDDAWSHVHPEGRSPPDDRSSAPKPRGYDLTLRVDAAKAEEEVRSQLSRIVEELGGLESGRVRLAADEDASPAGAEARLDFSLDPEDVIWWDRPPGEWTPRAVIRVRVETEAPESGAG